MGATSCFWDNLLAAATPCFDIAVIGGGINGAGIAADAAGRGLSVCLLEQDDLAAGTSSASSKLLHGGLRYLEHFEFSLVREALQERERLLRAAPHIVTPLRFILPHVDGMRSRWLLRSGLYLYDHLASRQRLPPSRAIRFSSDPSGRFLNANLTRGFSYWDCWVDDARLVVLNAHAAAQKKAKIFTRTAVTGFHPDPDDKNLWQIHASGESGRLPAPVRARVVVNAAGPWVDAVAKLESTAGNRPIETTRPRLRLVKGSHLVVSGRCRTGDAFILQTPDGRVVFVLPYSRDFTLIGTTDVAFDGDPASAVCDTGEETYLLNVVNRFMARQFTPENIVQRFSGVRPLVDDNEGNPSKVTRDYRLELRTVATTPPLLTVLGGKITTYRKLAEEAVNLLAPNFRGCGATWTAEHPLPGGSIFGDMQSFMQRLRSRFPNVDDAILAGLASRHGGTAYQILDGVETTDDMGQLIMPGLTEREVRHLRDVEWAKTADDVLWRRTKFGLDVAPHEGNRIREDISRILQAGQ